MFLLLQTSSLDSQLFPKFRFFQNVIITIESERAREVATMNDCILPKQNPFFQRALIRNYIF
ncbi:unnamed protein product [Arabidopsis halleri]